MIRRDWLAYIKRIFISSPLLRWKINFLDLYIFGWYTSMGYPYLLVIAKKCWENIREVRALWWAIIPALHHQTFKGLWAVLWDFRSKTTSSYTHCCLHWRIRRIGCLTCHHLPNDHPVAVDITHPCLRYILWITSNYLSRNPKIKKKKLDRSYREAMQVRQKVVYVG